MVSVLLMRTIIIFESKAIGLKRRRQNDKPLVSVKLYVFFYKYVFLSRRGYIT